MNYISELNEWDERVQSWIGDGAQLLHVSANSSDIRTYRTGDRIVKIRRLTPASVHGRPNSLEDEFHVLRSLNQRVSADPVVPIALSYRREREWEMFDMKAVPPPVALDPVLHAPRETMRGLARLLRAVWRLNRAGVSHGDLRPNNAGLAEDGTFVILDFDQALYASPIRCWLRDVFGVPVRGLGAQVAVVNRVRHLWFLSAILRPVGALRARARRRHWAKRGPSVLMARASSRGDPALSLLAEGWVDAAISGATTPGVPMAYYSLDTDGISFPGERPWALRWSIISRHVSFRGKRVVELGCNMALLSIHARLSGADSAVAADVNPAVLRAGEKAARAFQADVTFHRVDFDTDERWEERLGGGDIVSALSLTYWLRDKERLWRYLSSFTEVLFEGHEPPAETEERFRRLGFSNVRRIGTSERQRIIFHAFR